MKILLDTNIYIHVLDESIDKGKSEECKRVLEKAQQGHLEIVFNPLVVVELTLFLKRRFALLPKQINRFVKEIFIESDETEIPFQNTQKAFELTTKASLQYPDAFIAACTIENNLTLCSYDTCFRRVKDLRLKTPEQLLTSHLDR